VTDVSESERIAEAVRRAMATAEAPAAKSPGPVPLRELIAAFDLIHDEVPGLNCRQVARWLERAGVPPPRDLPDDDGPLAGYLFANNRGAYIFVNKDDALPRRRFSAAHELGHYLLHFEPGEEVEFVQGDEQEMIAEEPEEALGVMEREANRFAAELLMPEATCRRLHREAREQHAHSPRYLEHRIAGELLVSREAARWRLRSLKLI